MNKTQLISALDKSAKTIRDRHQSKVLSDLLTILSSQAFADFYEKEFSAYISGDIAYAIEQHCLVGDPADLKTESQKSSFTEACNEAALDVIQVKLAHHFARLL